MGPVLFSIYVNDLPKEVGDGIQMYADDTVIYGTDSQQLQRKLNSVVEWCSKNILTLNISKTKWMTTGLVRHIREHELRFKVKDMILEEVQLTSI